MLSVNSASLLMATAFGSRTAPTAELFMYDTLAQGFAGEIDAGVVASPMSMLLSLTGTAGEGGTSMLDVLSASYGADLSSLSLLAAYYTKS